MAHHTSLRAIVWNMGRGEAPNIFQTWLHNPASVRERVIAASERIAELGEWPEWISLDSLQERIPGETPSSGFDAGIACALDMIPRDKQRLAARLHAAYTPQAVKQVRSESVHMESDSETTWWLAACSVCQEGGVSEEDFLIQLENFEVLRRDKQARQAKALGELAAMKRRFEVIDGVAYATEDGGMQGAYLAGHPMAVAHDAKEDLYFIGTFYPSLGLENFTFSSDTDSEGRRRSGPVHGSRQFVKCSTVDEMQRALDHCLSKSVIDEAENLAQERF